jgi:hypothetical protein
MVCRFPQKSASKASKGPFQCAGQSGAVTYVKVGEVSELSVLIRDFGAGKVCALSALSAINPLFERKGGVGRLLSKEFMIVVPAAGLVSGQVVVPSCQRPVCRKRAPGRAPAHHAVIYSPYGPSPSVEIQSGTRDQSVLFNNQQLTMAERGMPTQARKAL